MNFYLKVCNIYILIINGVSFLFYGIDKFKAMKGARRIREATLLNFAIFGGVYGSLLGMYLFHHKTRKKLFKIVNFICLIIYTFMWYYFWRLV